MRTSTRRCGHGRPARRGGRATCWPPTPPTSPAARKPGWARACWTGSGWTGPGSRRWPASSGCSADAPFPPGETPVRDLPGGLRLAERRVPVGVIGANYEARPNVTVDVASQLLKSRNAGVLRTGGAALRSAEALFDHVIAPAVAAAGLDPGALQLVRSADRQAATELVRRARAHPAGDPARQRRGPPAPWRRKRPGTGAHPRARRRRRRAVPGRRRRSRHGGRDHQRTASTGSACATASTCFFDRTSAAWDALLPVALEPYQVNRITRHTVHEALMGRSDRRHLPGTTVTGSLAASPT